MTWNWKTFFAVATIITLISNAYATPGTIVQSVVQNYSASSSLNVLETSSQTYVTCADSSAPCGGTANSNLTVTITPTTNTACIALFFQGPFGLAVSGLTTYGVAQMTFMRGGTQIGYPLPDAFYNAPIGSAQAFGHVWTIYDSPGTTSPVTYSLAALTNVSGATAVINGGGTQFGVTITATEWSSC